MTLRTPRRRISPQTKLRYRAIKGFFRRALGTTSQPDLQITSSIAVNVTSIKQKINGLEQLNEVGRQHPDLCKENNSRKEFQSILSTELTDKISQKGVLAETQATGVETKLIYKTSGSQYKKSEESDCVHKENHESSKAKSNSEMNYYYVKQIPRLKKKKSKDNRAVNHNVNPNLHKHKTKSAYEDLVSAYSTGSFRSLDQIKEILRSDSGYGEKKKSCTKKQHDHEDNLYTRNRCQNLNSPDPVKYHEEEVENYPKSRKPKRYSKQLDQDFIADIIRRQYKPVKMFRRRQSDLSQFSVPVCRDRELGLTSSNCLQEDPQFCDYCCGGRHLSRNTRHSDHSDMRSVCDARLYSVKRNSRKKHRKMHADAHNDSDVYDLVPVKEKSSPKSRRKFYEDNLPSSACYKEVPPSPRSHRPRLNLKASYYDESDDNMDFVRNPNKKALPKNSMRHQETEEIEENYFPTEIRQMSKREHLQNLVKCQTQADLQREIGTMSSLQYPFFDNEDNTATVETQLDKTQDTESSADKTDKALSEIKNILQSFLQEIKKEASMHSGKSEVCSNFNENTNSSPNKEKIKPNSGQSIVNLNPVQCPVWCMPTMPPFGNTCCYPIMPKCPIKCMHNSYTEPSQSLSCNNCSNKSNEPNHTGNTTKNDAANDTFQCETDKLIKEIYKFVSQSPKFGRKRGNNTERTCSTGAKEFTSRSVGGSTRYCRHNVKVGTSKLRGVSRSCEAVGSKLFPEISGSDTNVSYSDTVLEKRSYDPTATQSISETDLTDLSETDKRKMNKFTRVMKSLGLYKKYGKKDVIEELSESESTIEVEVKKKSPLHQDIINYSMHGQKYYRPPPVSPHFRPQFPQDYQPPYNPEDPYHLQRIHRNEYGSPHPYHHPGQFPTIPPGSHPYESYNQMQPQVPLCMKEIEVKSIGCQSERKMSFFRKITKKAQQPADATQIDYQKLLRLHNSSTQTAQNKPKLFNWKNPPSNFTDSRNNPLAFGYKTQKKLIAGDEKMRNAMLKKMFHKRNPFSPNNLIIKTLLGKDKASYGEAPAILRPRMFL